MPLVVILAQQSIISQAAQLLVRAVVRSRNGLLSLVSR